MKKALVEKKAGFHNRNMYQGQYDFKKLMLHNPKLIPFVFANNFQKESIDFSKPDSVKALNQALLITDYGIRNWDIPQDFLCPPIPGRADYIHHIADLLAHENNGIIPRGHDVIGLDIGIGANCIYPILGHSIYQWQFVGTDINESAIQNCKKIIENNNQLIESVSLQLQIESRYIFKNIILPEDKFAFTVCNPPFHSSQDEANQSSIRKINALQNIRSKKPQLNFGGQNSELWTAGGELSFITQMIFESKKYPLQVLWFSTLVSKKEHLNSLYKTLNKVEAVKIETIDMKHGQKISRILTWTFMTTEQRKKWQFEM